MSLNGVIKELWSSWIILVVLVPPTFPLLVVVGLHKQLTLSGRCVGCNATYIKSVVDIINTTSTAYHDVRERELWLRSPRGRNFEVMFGQHPVLVGCPPHRASWAAWSGQGATAIILLGNVHSFLVIPELTGCEWSPLIAESCLFISLIYWRPSSSYGCTLPRAITRRSIIRYRSEPPIIF